MSELQITGGVVLVDDEDLPELIKYKWSIVTGYARRATEIKGKYRHILMHRWIMNAPDGMEVDHINGNRLDNRRCNLRLCTPSQNKLNIPRRSDNTSGYKGVVFHKASGKWMARTHQNGQQIYLGLYESPEQAYEVYLSKARELYGDFVRAK